jgi:hypothetical protein
MNNLIRTVEALLLTVLLITLPGCSTASPTESPAPEVEAEPIARTEFTGRVENFFEYEPLRVGRPSQFRIHLTDLSDGSPVEKAEVTLIVRPKEENSPLVETAALVGKVTGIYVAELNIPRAGDYDIEFRIKNPKLDERMPLSGFQVE